MSQASEKSVEGAETIPKGSTSKWMEALNNNREMQLCTPLKVIEDIVRSVW